MTPQSYTETSDFPVTHSLLIRAGDS